jgi:cytochrome c peroxidase
MNIPRQLLVVATACLVAACDSDGTIGGPSGPPSQPSLDAQVRQTIGQWGAVPILPLKPADPALVDLGRSLFFDKILSGNRDVSCAACHSPTLSSGDGRSLAVGTGGVVSGDTRKLGAGREFTPRNAPSLFNSALGSVYIFWDGRVSEEFGPGRFRTPSSIALPGGLSSLLAAQAMIPVTNRTEMRGNTGDRDVFGNTNELANYPDSENMMIWNATMSRLLAVQGYLQKFNVAYPGVPTSQLGFQHAANAIAAFEAQTFTKTNSPFDRFLARDDNAMSSDAKQGALLFFGRARCSQCHSGPLLGAQQFANVGVPQIGPGMGTSSPLDVGREDQFGNFKPPTPQFLFRVAALRNAELTSPYFHNGAYSTLEEVVRHYNNVDSALKAYDPSKLDAAVRATYQSDAATRTKLLATLDGRLRQPLGLTPEEQRLLVVFLKSLTDPSARDMSSVIPTSVPSGLPVK